MRSNVTGMAPESTPDDTRNDTPPAPFSLEPMPIGATPKSGRKRAKAPEEPWIPPRGIRYETRTDRHVMPFYLHWRDSAGQRKKQAFKDEAGRELVARELADKRDRMAAVQSGCGISRSAGCRA